MGKSNKRDTKANVFKIAGPKSHKKSKAKAVKNIKQKVQDIDAEFVEINKTSKQSPSAKKDTPRPVAKSTKSVPSKEEILKATEAIVKMDL